MTLAFPRDPWDLADWPWQAGPIRVLPVLRRLEFTRAVRAHLEFFKPKSVVVDLPRDAATAWNRAVESLPSIQALHWIPTTGEGIAPAWRVVQPADPVVEATRWSLENEAEVVLAGLAWKGGGSIFNTPDPASLVSIGYAGFVSAVCLHGIETLPREHIAQAHVLAEAARTAARTKGPVVAVCDFFLAQEVIKACREDTPLPLVRPVRGRVEVWPVDPDCLNEILAEAPFFQAAWERARAGIPPCLFEPPRKHRDPAAVLPFPGAAAPAAVPGPDLDLEEEKAAEARGEDLLGRSRLIYRLVHQAVRRCRTEGGPEISVAERRVLHRVARNMALLDGRLCPDLYELILCARGAVDDRFARELLELAGHWPWVTPAPGAVRLRAEDVGLKTRLVTLRPKIDRLARRPALVESLRRRGFELDFNSRGICSHIPEDLVAEGAGHQLARMGQARLHRCGVQVVPFTASLLDGLDPRETLRRMVFDGRPWVRQEIARQGEVGAVVLVFPEGEEPEAPERFPWCEVWYGEHSQESDMAFFATDPALHPVAPGIHRAEYGGFLLVWPPLRLGDIWREPAYRFCLTPAERLLTGALEYAVQPLVVFVSRRPPRPLFAGLARRLGRKIVHLRPGVLPAAKLRRLRTFHVLAGRELREAAFRLIDPQ